MTTPKSRQTRHPLQRANHAGRARRYHHGPRRDPLGLLRTVLDQMPRASSLDDLLERTIKTLHHAMGNTCTDILQLLPGNHDLFIRVMESEQPFNGLYRLPIDRGLIGAAAQSMQTVAVQNVLADPRYLPSPGWDMGSELCIPIVTRNGLWGILDMESRSLNAFPPMLVQVAEIIAQQLAIAVENTGLIDQELEQRLLLERRAHELAQVIDLNNQLRVSMDLDALLQHQASAIGKVMGFQFVVVNLIDTARNLVWVAATSGQKPEDAEMLRGATYEWDTLLGPDPARYRISQSYFYPAEAGYILPGVMVTPELGLRAPHEWQSDDMLLIPITNHRSEILGMFSVDNPLDRQRPSLATIQGLEIFAAHTAAAIENVRLFTQAQEAIAALKQSHDQQAQLLDTVQRAQSELITASKLAAVGTLAAGVAHEFNNLLAGMQGYAELGQTGTIEEKDEALAIIQRTCRRGVQITRQLLTFARQSDGVREMTNVDTIAENALQLISWDLSRAAINVVRDYRARTAVWAESGQIMQVILNLLSNARDATPPGGTVTIATSADHEWVELSVTDTGSGIEESIRERIFEPFVTTKGALGNSTIAGTGLGLSVSYGIVQAHAGRLLVESALGHGSRFVVQLPRRDEYVSPPPPPTVVPPARPMRILVVDDEPALRAMLGQLLTRAGHAIEHAQDGVVALEICQREPLDLIISDVTMPRLDGPTMIQKLRSMGIHTPVILMTGRVDGEALARVQHSGSIAMLAKPFDTAELLATITHVKRCDDA